MTSTIKGSDNFDTNPNQQLCSAWCVFDGTLTGTNPPLAGFNVASVTRNSAGNYTINVTSAYATSNYSVADSIGLVGGNRGSSAVYQLTINSFDILLIDEFSGGAGDSDYVSVHTFGGK